MDLSDAAFLFPGQGAQHVGMAVDLIDALPQVKDLFLKGSELCGHDLIKIVREGPEDRLKQTDISQVAIFLHSLAMLELIRDQNGAFPEAEATCGLSLGEYSALVYAGSIDPLEALEVVAMRGRFMQEAAEAEQGSMLTILGLDLETVQAMIDKARDGDVLVAANWNSPLQIVTSGNEGAIERLQRIAEEEGAKKTVKLKVAGGFHSPLMKSATEKLQPYLERLTIRKPKVLFVPNRTGTVTSSPEAIRRCLLDQITDTVLWVPSVQTLKASGITKAVELGPGRVLRGLVRRTEPEIRVTSINTVEQAHAFGFAHN